jgi:hypothetical protein
MTKAVFICMLAGLAAPLLVRAQGAGEDYATRFGGEGTVDRERRDDGPRTLTEAKQQHRGYRIGTDSMVHGAGGKDVHVVQEGDTLWDLSAHYFGDPWHWPELWSYNPEITNPHWIYPLDQIRLSPTALTQDEAATKVAQAAKGTPSGGLSEKAASAGLLAGTETAPPMVIPKGAWKPGMIFLRDEGYLDAEALKSVGQVIGGNAEQMLLSPTDQAYLKFGADQDVRPGQSYTVYREMQGWERNEHEQGKLIRILGTIVVRSYDKEKRVARGIVTEATDPIERGLFVAKLDRRFDLVAPKPNAANLIAHVIAAVQPYTLLAFGNVIFLDVGEGHGIQPGNRFFVVRRGDNWLEGIQAEATELGNIVEIPKYDPSVLPKEVVAELRVIKVRKNTTIAVVTRSDTDLAIGDVAEMRVGF